MLVDPICVNKYYNRTFWRKGFLGNFWKILIEKKRNGGGSIHVSARLVENCMLLKKLCKGMSCTNARVM